MLLPLGILASASGGAADYELITTALVTSTSATVTLANLNTLAAAYKHLQLRITSRDTRNGFTGSQLYLRFNGDTGSNYASHLLFGSGSSAGSAANVNADKIYVMDNPGLGGTTDAFGAAIVDILDFSNGNKNKTIRALTGMAQAYNWNTITSGHWRSIAAVESITFSGLGSQVAGSRFSLYGLKG